MICIAKGGFGMLSTAYLIMYNKGNKIFLARVDLICLSKADLICLSKADLIYLSKADLIYLQMCAAAGWTSLTKLGRVTVQMKTSCLFIHRMDKFDKARKSHGTDEDVLFVYTQGDIVGLQSLNLWILQEHLYQRCSFGVLQCLLFFLKAIFKPPLPQHQFKTVTRFNETCHYLFRELFNVYDQTHVFRFSMLNTLLKVYIHVCFYRFFECLIHNTVWYMNMFVHTCFYSS